MPAATSFFSQTINDSTVKSNGTPESTNWRIAIATLTAANLVAKTALINNLITAVNGVIIGEPAMTEVIQDRQVLSTAAAATQLAQRENKLLLRFVDGATNQKFTASIGTFDLSTLPLHSEFLDLTAGVGLALKTAFDAIAVNPTSGGDPVTLTSAQFVGRNT